MIGEIKSQTKITPVAYLNDFSGMKFIVRIERKVKSYSFCLPLNFEITKNVEIPKEAVASAVLKYGYIPLAGAESFEYGQRQAKLKSLAKKLQSEKSN